MLKEKISWRILRKLNKQQGIQEPARSRLFTLDLKNQFSRISLNVFLFCFFLFIN